MALYKDTMDSTRLVQPLGVRGRFTFCKVYFDNGKRLDYAGTVQIPGVLFEDVKTRPSNARIGFVPTKFTEA